MIADTQLQRAIVERLKSVSVVAANQVTVTVKDGIVILSGSVASDEAKSALEQAAKSAAGVRVIANEIEIPAPADHRKRDEDIAEAVLHVLQTDPQVPPTVKATVGNGLVTVTGHVQWEYQRDKAADAISRLPQVARVENRVDAV